jgi:transcriptional regulator with XRE-family HTH domain
MEFISCIGERLREERERLGLSQSDMAALAKDLGAKGATRQSQALYEKGEQSPSAAYIAAISTSGADVLYILTGMRNENTAFSPTELAYLRNCRALPTPEAKDAGLQMLTSLRKAYGVKW